MDQTILNVGGLLLNLALGWALKIAYDSNQKMDRKIERLNEKIDAQEKEIAAIRIELPTNYMPKGELRHEFDKINKTMELILAELKQKQDKQ